VFFICFSEKLNNRNVVQPRGASVERRFVSQTAPAYSTRITSNVTAANARAGRMPSTKTGGITRRANNLPTKRPQAIVPTTKTAPPMPTIAVTGMGGLRAIKAGMHKPSSTNQK
jgi:hypothetical protein